MARNTKYKMQEIENREPEFGIVEGINAPQKNFGTNIGGAGKPEENATAGATAGTDLKDSSENVLGDDDVITENGSAKNVYENQQVGCEFAVGQMGFLGADGKVYLTDGLTDFFNERFIGACMEIAEADDIVKFQVNGEVVLSGLTKGEKYYQKVGDDGASQASADATYNFLGASSRCGQTFQVASAKPITHIRLYLYYSSGGNGSAEQIEIYETSGGVPTGSPVATSNGYTPTLTESEQAIDFYFDTPFVPVVGTTYAFVTKGTDGVGYLRCRKYSSGGYASGTAITSSNGGSSWTAQSDDLKFYVYQGNGEVDASGTNLLVGLAYDTTKLSLR